MKDKIQIQVEGNYVEGDVRYIYHPLHKMFQVTFDDGYSNIFFTDVESGKWVEQDLGFTDLASEVGVKLVEEETLEIERRELQWYTGEHGVKGEQPESLFFGYYRYMILNYTAFEIYAPNRRYLYTIVQLNPELWQIFKIYGPAEWDGGKDLIDKLPTILENDVY